MIRWVAAVVVLILTAQSLGRVWLAWGLRRSLGSLPEDKRLAGAFIVAGFFALGVVGAMTAAATLLAIRAPDGLREHGSLIAIILVASMAIAFPGVFVRVRRRKDQDVAKWLQVGRSDQEQHRGEP